MQSTDFFFREIIYELILRKCMHHAPPLFPQLPYLIEDGDALVISHHQPDQAQCHECAGAAYSCTAVHEGDFPLAEEVEEGVDDDIESLPALLAGDVAVGPVRQLVVAHDPRHIREGVPDLQFLKPQGLLVSHLLFLQQGDLIFLLGDGGSMWIFLGEVAITLDLVLLDEAAEHEDGRHFVMFDHPPEIVEAVGEWSLSGHASLPLQLYHIGVDVILHFLMIRIGDESCSGGIECHETCVAIERELFWVFVEFVHVVLCLGHECEQLELSGEAAFETLQSEVDLRDLFGHLTQVLVLRLPLLGDVVVVAHLIEILFIFTRTRMNRLREHDQIERLPNRWVASNKTFVALPQSSTALPQSPTNTHSVKVSSELTHTYSIAL